MGGTLGRAMSTSTSNVERKTAGLTQSCSVSDIADRVKGALYGLLIADALAMPSHWYYGGAGQVASQYGKITTYVKPVTKLPGSIMSKSDTGGGGRGGFRGDVIGGVIFHNKKKYWAPGANYHYHQGMEAGDNTLEAILMRRVVNITAAAGGEFAPDDILADYMKFMQTPNTHNDTYCGTAHRMFFANLAGGKDPKDCPDNDGHNVDTCDAFITAVPIALLPTSDEKAEENVKEVVRLTRKSPESERFGAQFARLLRAVVFEGADVESVIYNTFRMKPRGPDPVTA